MLIKIIPEIGHFALVIALLMAVVQAVMPLAGAATRRRGGPTVTLPPHWLNLNNQGSADVPAIVEQLTRARLVHVVNDFYPRADGHVVDDFRRF